MSSVDLPFGLQFKNTLDAHTKFHTLLNDITKILKQIHALEDLKKDPELLLLICNLVKNSINVNKWKIDKKELVVAIQLFNDTDDEKAQIRSLIQFFYDNNKIKKQKRHKLIMSYSADWLKRKFL